MSWCKEETSRGGYNAGSVARLIEPSHHLCWFYDEYEEILDFTIQYCIDSITHNYVSVCHFVDDEVQEKYRRGEINGTRYPNHKFLNPREVIAGLEKRGVEVDKAIESGQLRLFNNHEIYLNNGTFQADLSVNHFREYVLNARAAGYAGVRVYGDMAFAYGHIGQATAFKEFEAKICLIQEDFPDFVGVCCFDRKLFSAVILKDALQTHPVAAIKEKYYKYNFYFVPPKKILRADRSEEEILSSWLKNLEERSIMDKQTEGLMAEMRKQNSELNQVIARNNCTERIDEVTEALAAQKQTFISNISHEIRTPLTGILGGIDLLTSTMISEDQKKLLQYLLPSVRQLSRVLSDVLSFDQEITLNNSLMMLKDTVELSINEAESISAANLDLHIDSKADISVSLGAQVPEYVYADEARIRQVLVNLISNSIKFSNGKINVHIDIKVINKVNERVQLQFSIFDNGIGLIPGDTSKIFNSFWQLDQSSSKRYGGTGLGLAITKSLITLMGGDITARSPGLNRGTCVEFTIWVDSHEASYDSNGNQEQSRSSSFSATPPKSDCCSLSSSPLSTPPSPLSSSPTFSPLSSSPTCISHLIHASSSPDIIGFSYRSPSPSTPPDRGFIVVPADVTTRITPVIPPEMSVAPKHVSILLVEDNVINAKIIMQLLKSLGYTAQLAKNGVEAVDAAASSHFDVIFMDLHMPIMDGFQATQEILSRVSPTLNSNPNPNPNPNPMNSLPSPPLNLNERFESLPPRIFALTASASESDKRKCETIGMVGHLAKPVSKFALLHALCTLSLLK